MFLSSTSALSRDSFRSGQTAAMECNLSASDLSRKNIFARLTRRFFEPYYTVRFAHSVILTLQNINNPYNTFSKEWPWEQYLIIIFLILQSMLYCLGLHISSHCEYSIRNVKQINDFQWFYNTKSQFFCLRPQLWAEIAPEADKRLLWNTIRPLRIFVERMFLQGLPGDYPNLITQPDLPRTSSWQLQKYINIHS